jgi:hypothetical protein
MTPKRLLAVSWEHSTGHAHPPATLHAYLGRVGITSALASRRNYLACDLGALFAEQGLQPDMKRVSVLTKTLSFRKPGGAVAEA